jgi:hypothetical protein
LDTPPPTRSGTGVRDNGSRLDKVNIWMWIYGWDRPRIVSIAEAERIRA